MKSTAKEIQRIMLLQFENWGLKFKGKSRQDHKLSGRSDDIIIGYKQIISTRNPHGKAKEKLKGVGFQA